MNIKRVRLLKDSAMVRAALVIDYLCRNAESSNESKVCQYSQTTIPTAMLANVIGFTNKKDVNKFQSMQTVIASYLDGTSIDQRKKIAGQNKTQSHSRKRDHSDTAAPLLDAPKKSTRIKPSSLIRHLCIQLGTMISDAEFVNSYAEQLFSDMQSTTSKPDTAMNFSKLELYKDIERNQVYYEAACFYLAVLKSEGDRSHSLVKGKDKNNSISQRKDLKSRKLGNQLHQGVNDDDAEEDHEVEVEEERPLNEFDVIREANLLEGTFRTVLVALQTVGESITSARMSPKRKLQTGTPSTTPYLFMVPDSMDEEVDDRGRRRISPHREWKEKVLHDAKMSVQEQLKETDGQEDWLSIAAEEVLRKAGLSK